MNSDKDKTFSKTAKAAVGISPENRKQNRPKPKKDAKFCT
jgi:hypothetical protein